MNNINDLYNRWLAQPDLDDAVKAELVSIAGDSDAVTDRFYRDLEFGTGGLRGILGAGTNRMNIHVVRRAAQATADVLNAAGLPRRAAIGYDSRIGSERFARETACVLAANGIETYLYPRLEPVPALSFAVRALSCGRQPQSRAVQRLQGLRPGRLPADARPSRADRGKAAVTLVL